MDDITNDLVSNVERISSHGQRADRIVNDMLQMGRGGQEFRPADLNALLEEHARLAYHSARGHQPGVPARHRRRTSTPM